jgi:hypothetical protein
MSHLHDRMLLILSEMCVPKFIGVVVPSCIYSVPNI